MKIIVIGGGPGGYVAAIRAAQLGGEVTLIERNLLGGTCLNEGCIPTKAILHVSELLEQIRDGSQWGVRVDAPYIEWKQVQEKKKKIVKQLTSGVAGLLRANKVKVISGTAAFVDARTLEVRVPNGKAKRIKGDKIIVAAGSVPAIPPISGIKDTPACMDSTEALALSEVPGSLLVIGGGVVGMELAAAYHALGSRVTVIESMTRLLPMIDGELSSLYQSIIQKKGIEVYTNTRAKSIEQMGDGACVSVEKTDGDAQFIVDKVLIATGRRANTTGLNLDAAGILHDHGRIVANSKMETSVPGIYVAGDCLGHDARNCKRRIDGRRGSSRKHTNQYLALPLSSKREGIDYGRRRRYDKINIWKRIWRDIGRAYNRTKSNGYDRRTGTGDWSGSDGG